MARREKCYAVAEMLGERVEKKVAAVAGLAAPEGYSAPLPPDPTICGVESFKCEDIERPGSYLQKVNARRLAEYEANRRPAEAAKPLPKLPGRKLLLGDK